MKKTNLATIVVGLLIFTGCSGSNENSNYGVNDDSYEEAKISIEDQEKDNPLSFLTVDAKYRKNLLGEWVIEGKINNSATVAVFKDVKLSILFNSKTDSYLGSETHTVYEFVKPGQSTSFKIKTYAHKVKGKSKKIELDILGAQVK
jgi:hypothetical protein